jgi:hypothetical protein
VHPGPVRHGQAELGEAFPHEQFVLRVEQRVGSGVHGDATLHQRAQDRLRHVFVVERDHVDGLGEREHGPEIPVIAHRHRGESRRHAVGFGQDPKVDTEVDRGGDHHAGQLTATDHTNNRAHLFTNFCASVHPSAVNSQEGDWAAS